MKTGYKAFELKNGVLTCHGVEYFEGKTHEVIGKIVPCECGIHYCKQLKNLSKYIDFTKSTIVYEIEDIGETSIDHGTKTVTNKIRLIKQITKGLPVQYDKNGNLIYQKDSNGNEWWYDYDSHNNLIHLKTSYGYEEWYEYDSHNNMIHAKDSNGDEAWYDYDSHNNQIHYKTSNGYETWYDYDSNNNQIHYKTSNGYETWYDYDSNNNRILAKSSNGDEWRYEYSYDEQGRMIERKQKRETFKVY